MCRVMVKIKKGKPIAENVAKELNRKLNSRSSARYMNTDVYMIVAFMIDLSFIIVEHNKKKKKKGRRISSVQSMLKEME